MTDIKIISKEYIPIVEVVKTLKTRKDEDRNYEQKLVWEHVNKKNKISLTDSKKLIKELSEFDIRRLKEEMIIQIVDIMPSNLKELKSIFAASKTTLQDDELVKIMDLLKNYVK